MSNSYFIPFIQEVAMRMIEEWNAIKSQNQEPSARLNMRSQRLSINNSQSNSNHNEPSLLKTTDLTCRDSINRSFSRKFKLKPIVAPEEENFEDMVMCALGDSMTLQVSPPASAIDYLSLADINDSTLGEQRISPSSVALLAEGVPSQVIETLDPTFKRPVVSPPYSQIREAKKSAKKGVVATRRAKEIILTMEKVIDFELEEVMKQKKGFSSEKLPEKERRMVYTHPRGISLETVLDKLAQVQKKKEDLVELFDKQLDDARHLLEEKKLKKQRQIIHNKKLAEQTLELKRAASATVEEAEQVFVAHRRASTQPPSAGQMRKENFRSNKIISNLVGQLIMIEDSEEPQKTSNSLSVPRIGQSASVRMPPSRTGQSESVMSRSRRKESAKP
ncbi:hypothetical protein HK096_000095, partial [Nowakowskiella sp. JEL0078]